MQKVQGFCACWHSCSDYFTNFLFFSYNGPYAEFSYLEMAATTAADLDLLDISCNSTFSHNVTTFLCFSGALPAALVALRVGSMVLLKVYNIALNMMKNVWGPWEITSYCNSRFTGETNSPRGNDQRHGHFKWTLETLKLSTAATGGDEEIVNDSTGHTAVHSHRDDFILQLHVCLSTAPCTFCVCVLKFWQILTFYNRFVSILR